MFLHGFTFDLSETSKAETHARTIRTRFVFNDSLLNALGIPLFAVTETTHETIIFFQLLRTAVTHRLANSAEP